MFITLFRVIIMYIFIILIMRIMGKRQLGELQSYELVITFMISGIAAIPIQENSIPMLQSIVAITILAALEIIVSVLTIKVPVIKKVLMGNAVTIIKNGQIDQKQLKRLRLSVSELTDNLRSSGFFNLEDIQYATVETNGIISVLLKPDKRPPTASQVTANLEDTALPALVIEDGAIDYDALSKVQLSVNDINAELRKHSLKPEDVFIMTADSNRNFFINPKEK